MNNRLQQLNNDPKILYWICALLTIPALLVHLGIMPLYTDEPTRAIVALEMKLSGNYMVPTINGELYYNKPPLYNWILIGFYEIFGETEFATRLPNVLSLLGFATTLYLFFKNKIGKQAAFLSAMALVTMNRILFYDSLIGLIDITFSWLTFTLFIVIYHYHKKEQYTTLYFLAYAITFIGCLLKGLPSLVFLGFTLLVWFIYKRKFKQLFHWSHFVSFAIFIGLILLYFYLWQSHTPGHWQDYISRLWSESSGRTEGNLLIHLTTFPLVAIIAQILPWGILCITLFKKGVFQSLQRNPIIVFCSLVFMVNILVYWISPQTRPRYLFMLYPLLFPLLFLGYELAGEVWRKNLDKVFLSLLVLITLACAAAPFIQHEHLGHISHLTLKFSLLTISLSVILYCWSKLAEQRLILLAISLLILKIGFQTTVLEVRAKTEPIVAFTDSAKKVGQLLGNNPVYMWHESHLNHEVSYYISRATKHIVRYDRAPIISGKYYIIDEDYLKRYNFTVLYKFRIRWENRIRYLVYANEAN